MTRSRTNTGARKGIAIPVTRVTSVRPAKLTKQFRLVDGQIEKSGGGVLVDGEAKIETVAGLDSFAKLLTELRPNQALIYGLPRKSPARLTTRQLWLQAGEPADTQPRTAEMFAWNDGPGIMMLDHDPEPGAAPLTRDELVARVRDAVPGLRDAAMLWWPSASSHIVNSRTGEDLTGLRGQRLYIAVQDARDLPRAGKALVDLLWLAGYGYCRVSTSGALLERTLVDASVWQTNRLDFAAGAACRSPLTQKRGTPVRIAGSIEVIDSAAAVPNISPEQRAKIEEIRHSAKIAKRVEAEQVRSRWLETRIDEMAGANADESRRANASRVAQRALEHGILSGDYQVFVLEDGAERVVSINEALDNPNRFHGCLTLDPIEPDYDGRRQVGMLFLKQARPVLFSFAHGGASYRLSRDLVDIEIVPGKIRQTVDATLNALRSLPDTFDFGGALVVVDGSKTHALDESGLAYHLGDAVQFWRWRPRKGLPIRTDENPPRDVLKQILALGERRQLKPLEALITAPTLRRDGSLLDLPGYDAETRLFLDMDDQTSCSVVRSPRRRQVQQALQTLLFPFREFPFASSDDWGVFLAALLTSVVRPVLPTAPAFGFDAPVQGSGKTLLASCIGMLATGRAPAVYPPVAGRDDEETRKRLFAALHGGERVIVWDNLVGTFDSPAMAAALTGNSLRDRVLGRTETLSVPNRAFLLLTGNNLTLAGDMARRVLTCRVDPQTERPFARKFDLEPLEHVRAHRQEMVSAALTIMLGHVAAGALAAPGRMASFEHWDDRVRQAVCWVAKEICPGEFGDPMNAVIMAQGADPEQELLASLLDAWIEIFGTEWTSSVQITQKILYHHDPRSSDCPEARLAEAIKAFNDRAASSPVSLGHVLRYRVDRIVHGKRLETCMDTHSKTKLWRVVTLKPSDT